MSWTRTVRSGVAALAAAALFFPLTAAGADATDLYFLALLRPDPARKPLSKDDGDRIQAAHMANIRSMAERGVLVAAGPFEDQPVTISGLFLFRTSSLDEARRIAEADPTVVEHRNRADVHAWRGPKGIGAEYRRLHKANADTPEGMGVQPLFLMYRGPAWVIRSKQLSEHEAYLDRLRRDGKLAMAGPTEGDDKLLAMVVFQRIPDEEARRLIAEDPVVKAGVLMPEFHRWWCAEHVIP